MKITKRHITIICYTIGCTSILFIFLFWGPPAFYNKTSSPEFCASCHVMDYHYESWYKSGLHNNVTCVDCHLPNNNLVNHMIWKGIDGMKDVIYFYGNLYTEPVTISKHGKQTIQQNCLRCHKGMVSMINTDGRTCWTCHRQTQHTFPTLGLR